MIISNCNYNVPEITIEENLTPDVETVVGTKEEFDSLYSICTKSGLARVNAKISNVEMHGTMLANWDSIGLEFVTVTNQYGSGRAMIAHLEPDGDDAKVTITVKSLD